MSVRAETIIRIIEGLAPKNLAMNWDNVGLQLGNPAQEVKRILITLDLTESVLNQAEELGVEMIITHHPLFWEKINRLNYNTFIGKAVSRLIKSDIVVYSAHTNLDIAAGGINDYLAKTLNLEGIEPLEITTEDSLFKIVVFVPKDYLEQVREALAAAGAGWLGNYSHCSFQAQGIGTFKPLAGANPFLGEVGQLEYVEEYRLETIVPQNLLNRAVKAMLKAHPYEEVAYDIYPLKNEGVKHGLGRIGYLSVPLTLQELSQQVKSVLGVPVLRVCGDLDKLVKKVAVCGGSGMGTIKDVLLKGADLLLTGDIKYHDAQDALAQGIALIDAGHFPTENIFIPVLVEYLNQKLSEEGKRVEVFQAKLADPFIYV